MFRVNGCSALVLSKISKDCSRSFLEFGKNSAGLIYHFKGRTNQARISRIHNASCHDQKLKTYNSFTAQSPSVIFLPKRFISDDTYSRNVNIELDQGDRNEVNVTWLRENCSCDQCFNHSTHQRSVLFHQLSSEAFDVKDVTNTDKQVTVTWGDGHRSQYTTAWLRKYVHSSSSPDPNIEKIYWSAKDMKARGLPRIQLEDLQNKSGKVSLLEALLRFGVATVVGVEPTLEGTLKAAGQIAKPLITLYGDHWTFGDVNADDKFEDTAYSNVALGGHTDGTYYLNPPGVQILHCMSSGAVGGESLIVDGFYSAQRLREQDEDLFRVLAEDFSLDHTYTDPQNTLHSHTRVLHLHPVTKQLQYIRYNPYNRSTFKPTPISTSGRNVNVGRFYAAMARLSRLLEDEEAQYWFRLEPGTVIFMDNWRVLHGRAAFTGVRRMAGCYLGRDELMSAARKYLEN